MSQAPTWIQQIEPDILSALDMSEWKALPPFPLNEFMQNFSGRLGITDCTIEATPLEGIQPVDFFQNMGDTPLTISFEVQPLRGMGCFILNAQDVAQLIRWTSQEGSEPLVFENTDLIKGFYTYLLCEAMASVQNTGTYGTLAPKIHFEPFTEEHGLCTNVSLTHAQTSVWGRLIFSPALYESLNEHFTQQQVHLEDLGAWQNLTIPLTLNAGSVTLSATEWDEIHEGDFICLEHCHYHPNEQKGSFQLGLEDKALFQVRIKEGQCKILDYIYGVTPTSDYEETIMDDELEPPPESEPEEEEALEPAPPQVDTLSLRDVPFDVQVEVTRLQITLDELQKMQPGHQIPLDVNPRNVKLTVRGKAIGAGELIEIGDTVGVRILEIYK